MQPCHLFILLMIWSRNAGFDEADFAVLRLNAELAS
jgi:hypothetical protein